VVEIGGNGQSCDPSTLLLFKMVLEVVLGDGGSLYGQENTPDNHSIPWKRAEQQAATKVLTPVGGTVIVSTKPRP
jgi:hypothetical protein